MKITDMRLPRWIVVWLCITAAIQTYDALFVILGPVPHVGGPLAGLWPGHLLYARFDQRYANFDAFGTAQSWANLVEVVVALIAVRLRARFSGVILTLILCVATFWKTVLYFAVEISGGLEMTRDAEHRIEQSHTPGPARRAHSATPSSMAGRDRSAPWASRGYFCTARHATGRHGRVRRRPGVRARRPRARPRRR
jgi:hypothetical protein